MRTFAFIPTQSLSKAYGSFLHKYRKYDNVIELLKLFALGLFLLVCIFSYLFFVNKASTRGYTLKQENRKLDAISFQSEILKTKLLAYKQINWDAIHGSAYKRDVVEVSAEVVKIPTTVELGFLAK